RPPHVGPQHADRPMGRHRRGARRRRRRGCRQSRACAHRRSATEPARLAPSCAQLKPALKLRRPAITSSDLGANRILRIEQNILRMNIIEPGIRNLATAKDVLLTPYGIDEARLTRTLADIFTHRIDYADLYFQATRSEAWSLEEGIVKSGSFSIDKGVGVRAIAGDRTAFAYSDDLSPEALAQAAQATRSIGKAGGGKQKIKVATALKGVAGRDLYLAGDPLASLDATEKVKLLERIEQMARSRDTRITQVMAGLAGEYDVVLVARSDGVLAADVRPLVRVSVTVIAEQNGRREIGSGGGGGRFDYGYFSDDILARYVDDAVKAALVNLDARPAPAGTMTVVLGPGWPGVLLHEAIGHGLEGDFNRKGSSAFAGRTGERVAAEGVTVVDDGTLAQRRGSLNIDDEGT